MGVSDSHDSVQYDSLLSPYLLPLGVRVLLGPNSSVTASGRASAPQHHGRGKHGQWARRASVRDQYHLGLVEACSYMDG